MDHWISVAPVGIAHVLAGADSLIGTVGPYFGTVFPFIGLAIPQLFRNLWA